MDENPQLRPSERQRKATQRSRTGCLYCRRRKIKCDERRPSCGNCSKAGRHCDRTSTIFRPHESSFSASKPMPSPWKSPSLPPSSADSASDSNVWVQVPSQVVFVHENSHQQTTGNRHLSIEDLTGQSMLLSDTTSTPMRINDLEISRETSQTQPSDTYSTLIDHTMSIHSGDSPLSEHGRHTTFQHRRNTDSSYVSHQSSLPEKQFELEESSPDENRETSFFLRHFSETPGRWMDLFDLDEYYRLQVPILASRNPLVKYAACAFAAKQLGRVQGKKSVRGGVCSRPADMEALPEHRHASMIDYSWYGMKYYDKSISLLMKHISQADHAHRDGYNRRYNDEIIVAATILCVYEFLSATTAGWSRHLDGTQSLLQLEEDQNLFQFQPSPRDSAVVPEPPKALKAAFWNFARQDFLASLITKKLTRLNTHDLDMWRAMGLLLDDDGLVSASNHSDPSERRMRDDMICNALVFLLSKICNFISQNSVTSHVEGVDRAGMNENEQIMVWQSLDHQLTIWHQGLPDSFQPSARIKRATCNSIDSCLEWEFWYSNSMCASTMQSYHMARILLLIHRPTSLLLRGISLVDRDMLSRMRSIQSQLRSHATEICSIALGRPDDSARVHQLQPLYMAGRCLTGAEDQAIVIDLIKRIESDLGWASDYRVEQLLQEWEDHKSNRE